MRRTCVMCGRVGTRVFMRDAAGRTVCRNKSACVTRLCDKLFRPKPKPTLGNGWIELDTVISNVRFYGVVECVGDPATLKATLEIV